MNKVMWVYTPHGEGLVLFVLDDGPFENLIFVVADREDGRVRHYNANQITLIPGHIYGLNVKNQKPSIDG